MYCSLKEEKIIYDFYSYLSDSKFAKEQFLLVWENGTKILCTFFTGGDDDNGLDLDDPNYEDYTSFVMKIEKIIYLNERDGFNWIKDRELFEFNYHNFPCEIYNSKGKLISKNEY